MERFLWMGVRLIDCNLSRKVLTLKLKLKTKGKKMNGWIEINIFWRRNYQYMFNLITKPNHYHYYCCYRYHHLHVSYYGCLFYHCFLLWYFFINFKDFCDAHQCQQLEFTPVKAFDGRRLINHVIHIVEVLTMNFCDNMCYMEPDCVGINLYKRVSRHGGYRCEWIMLLTKDTNATWRRLFFHHAAEVSVVSPANTYFKWMEAKDTNFNP